PAGRSAACPAGGSCSGAEPAGRERCAGVPVYRCLALQPAYPATESESSPVGRTLFSSAAAHFVGGPPSSRSRFRLCRHAAASSATPAPPASSSRPVHTSTHRRTRSASPATGAGTAQRWARSRVPARTAPPSGRKAAVRTHDVLDGLIVLAAAAPPSGRKAAIPTASVRALSQGRGGPTGLPVATSQRCSVWPRVAVRPGLPSVPKATRGS